MKITLVACLMIVGLACGSGCITRQIYDTKGDEVVKGKPAKTNTYWFWEPEFWSHK